jgi:hypothetical protein
MIDNLNKEAYLQNIITAKKGRRDFTQQQTGMYNSILYTGGLFGGKDDRLPFLLIDLVTY